MKAWLSKSKFYFSDKWYCSRCQNITPVQLNPVWLAVGKPFNYDTDKYDFDWFARCSICGKQHFSGSYGCPDCGFDDVPGEFYFYIGKKSFDCTGYNKINGNLYGKLPLWAKLLKPEIYPVYGCESWNHEGGRDWLETHWCPYCKQEFSFMNGT